MDDTWIKSLRNGDSFSLGERYPSEVYCIICFHTEKTDKVIKRPFNKSLEIFPLTSQQQVRGSGTERDLYTTHNVIVKASIQSPIISWSLCVD